LPHVIAQKADFKPQEITSLLWAMAKLGGDGQERTPGLNEAVAVLLPHVKAQKQQFNAQCIANLLWAMAKVTDNGHERTPEFIETLVALLPHVLAQKANFKPLEVANLLWAMAKLVDNGQEQTPGLKKAVAALLPHVNAQKDQFIPQHIAILLWAMAKLVDNGQEQTPGLKKAVAALLPLVNAQKDQFIPQHIANLLWAMAKLVDNGQEQTPELKEALAELLPLVNAQKDQFISQHIANLLWAMAKLGELVELNVVTSTFESLVYRISENPQLSQKDILMSLWGVMVCCARLSLVSNTNKNNVLEKHMDDLFVRLENTSPDNEEDQRIIAMAASWVGRASPVVPHYQTTISKPQADLSDQLQSCIPYLKIEEEKSLNSLPPVDLLLPDHNIVIEVQGLSHYVGGDFKTRNGSTLLKIALLQKSGFEVIEIPVKELGNLNSMKLCIDHIKTKVDVPPQGHDSVLLKRRWADEAYVTADKRG
ncbi:RAP domain-containing protein, partial [Salinisphaera sp. G21_0]|uniref:RAP domain-containing protein n=1 Tax=Salinisphaera sp. G21_0 TaxID=2821094 RepID=UPI001ADA6239